MQVTRSCGHATIYLTCMPPTAHTCNMHMALKVIHQLPVAATAKNLSTTDAPQRPVERQRGKTKSTPLDAMPSDVAKASDAYSSPQTP